MTLYITVEGPVTIGQQPPAPAPYMHWHVGPVGKKGQSPMPIEVSMSTEEFTRLQVIPKTPGGGDATLDGPVVWSVESGDCTLQAIDNVSTYVLAGTTPGDAVVLATADADLGEGFRHIQDTCLLHIAHAQAGSLGMTADAPQLKPPPA